MPRGNPNVVPLVFNRWRDEFTEIDWTMTWGATFEVSQTLDVMLKEAGSKGMTVVVNAGLVPTEQMFPPPDEGAEEGEQDE